MRNLDECRKEIDAIDHELLRLFCRRMNVASEVAAYKKAHGLPVLNAGREEAILERIAGEAGEPFGGYARELYRRIFELSRAYQTELNCGGGSDDGK